MKNVLVAVMLVIGLGGGRSAVAAGVLGGSTTDPIARQGKCAADGGYYNPSDGSGIPNAACRQAFQYGDLAPWERTQMFTDANAYSQNLAGTTHLSERVPDGQLCSAGISNFRGINVPSPDWFTSSVNVTDGRLVVTYRASRVDSPSKWSVYVSRPGFDPSTQILKWDDLVPATVEKLEQSPDGAKGNNAPKMYRIHVKLPDEYVKGMRSILYVQWERDDPARETFFGCSDVILN